MLSLFVSCVQNLTSLQIMDTIVRGAGQRGMKVILDYHRLNAGYLHEWGLWYDAYTSETQWINNWLFLVDRFKNDSTVVAVRQGLKLAYGLVGTHTSQSSLTAKVCPTVLSGRDALQQRMACRGGGMHSKMVLASP